MMCVAWPTLKPELTWDGLLTFITGILAFLAGLLAFLGIRSQICHADRGLQLQLDAEKRSREDDASSQRRAVATALLFELDNFYRGYVRGMAGEIGSLPGQVDGRHYVVTPDLPPFRKVPSAPFPVYGANAASVGSLPSDLTAHVLRAYSGAQWILDRVADYQLAREQSFEHGNQAPYFTFARKSLEELVPIYHGAEGTLSTAMKELCNFAGVTFGAPLIAIAELEHQRGADQRRSSDPPAPLSAKAI